MPLQQDEIKKIIKKYKISDNDTGSAQVQIALLTHNIKHLTKHIQKHPKDNDSRFGLMQQNKVRRKLMKYLKRTSLEQYQKLAKDLSLRG